MLKPESELVDILSKHSTIKPEAYLEMAVKTEEFVKDNSTMSRSRRTVQLSSGTCQILY